MTISQNEAIRLSIAVSTAMLNDDKQAREMVYAELSAKDLQRVLRWTTRQFIQTFSAMSVFSQVDPHEAWQSYCANALASLDPEDEDK